MLSKNTIIKHNLIQHIQEINSKRIKKKRDTKETTDSEIITKCGLILDSS